MGEFLTPIIRMRKGTSKQYFRHCNTNVELLDVLHWNLLHTCYATSDLTLRMAFLKNPHWLEGLLVDVASVIK